MSDQQDVSDLGSEHSHGAQQSQVVQVEGMDSMRVKVTNIVDGFFRFANSRSQSNLSSSNADMSASSGRSSPFSASSSKYNHPSSSDPPVHKPKPTRKVSTKKVKFKEDNPYQQGDPPKLEKEEDNDTDTPDTNDSPTARSMEPLDAQFEASKFYMDESSWGVRHKRINPADDDDESSWSGKSDKYSASSGAERDSFAQTRGGDKNNMNQSQRTRFRNKKQHSDDMIDCSASSQASWNVHLDPGGNVGTEATMAPVGGGPGGRPGLDFFNDKPTPPPPPGEDQKQMWFEKYMPNWVISIRAFCGSVVLDDRFQLVMVLLITANAIVMGLGTFDFVTENPSMENLFTRIDFIFLCIFTVELALQFGYWGYQVFTDGWLLFDFVTVMSSWLTDGVQVFRSFRVFRAFRLVVRIPILKSLVYAVLHVMPRISSIMGLFGLLTYIYAVMATTLYKDYYRLGYTDDNYFGRLDYSVFTLFQFVTLEGWADIVRMVAAQDYFANFIFGSFLTISGFILYSLVVAVVCDSFLLVETKIRRELQQKAREAREKRKALKKRQAQRKLKVDDNDASMSMQYDESDLEMEELDRRMSMNRSRLDDATPKKRAGWKNSSFLKRPDTKPDLSPGRYKLVEHPANSRMRDRSDKSQSKSRASSKYINEVDPDEEEGTDDEDFQFQAPSEHVTNTKTLFAGELEQKKNKGKRRKKKPVRQRIKRVRKRLDKLTVAQSEILTSLDRLCKEMERRNGIAEQEDE